MCIGVLWLLSEVLWMSEGQRYCNHTQNICYELNHTLMTHNDADRFCRNRQGQLAAIWDLQTQRYIEHLVGNQGERYWIGGKLYVMEHWTWVDGSLYPGQQTFCH